MTMHRIRTFVIAAVCSSVAGVASATVSVNVTPVVEGSGFSGPESALTDFSSFAVSVSSTGEILTAVFAVFNGPMHQSWTGTTTADPTLSTFLPDTSGDSALALADPDLTIFELLFDENNNVSQSPLADTFQAGVGGHDFGIGDQMSGAWGLIEPFSGTSTDVAYLVIPDGESVSYSIQVTDTTQAVFELTGTIEAVTQIPGDADGDGDVDSDDFNILAFNFGGTGGFGEGDFDADGDIDSDDFNILAFNFGTGVATAVTAPSITAVPEPASLALLTLGGLGLLRRRRA